MFTFFSSLIGSARRGALTLTLLLTLLAAAPAQAARPALSPARATLTPGQLLVFQARGAGCQLTLPSGQRLRVRSALRARWRPARKGRYQAQLRCGRKLLRSSVLVHAPRTTAPVDPDTGDATDTPPVPQPSVDQQVQDWWEQGMREGAWYRNNNNPYDTSNHGGWCHDWVMFKRPDIMERVMKFYLHTWISAGKPLEDVFGGSYVTPAWDGAPWAADGAWTTWAQRAGLEVTRTPRPGTAVLLGRNHVAYVEEVYPSTPSEPGGAIRISEMGWNGRPGLVHTRDVPTDAENVSHWNMWFIG